MEIYNLKSTYSKIMRVKQFEEKLEYDIKVGNPNNMIPISIIKFGDQDIFIEYIRESEATAFLIEQQELRKEISQKPQAQVVESKELVEAKNTILNTDPFGSHRHAGKTLGEIVATDMEWVNHALKNMTNEYIRNRLQLIVDSMR